jgi:predicted dehydrogenase
MTIKVGLIGCGGITSLHVPGWLSVQDRAEIVAVADPSEENVRQRVAQIGHDVKVYKDYRDLLADGSIDAVDLALPHFLHCESIVAAAEAGKHLMTEKPLCLNLDEAAQIQDAVDKSGIVMMAGHNFLFCPPVLQAKQMIMQGDLGKIFMIDSIDSGARRPALSLNKATWDGKNKAATTDTWRNDPAKMGGGELIDTGYHPTYRMVFLADSKAKEVSAVLGTYRLPLNREDTANLLIKFENGVTGRIFSSWGVQTPGGRPTLFNVAGEAGQLWGEIDRLYFQPVGFTSAASVEFPGWDYARTFAAEIAHFCSAIEGGFEPLHSAKEATETLRIILAGYEAAEKGITVKM